MLGEDTLLFTKNGFKTLKELDLYDEVLTPFGEFEPIVEMGPWKPVDRVMQLNTLENIYCSDNLLCYTDLDAKFTYVDDLDCKIAVPFGDIFEFEGDGLNHPVSNGYDFTVVVPTCIPDAYILSNLYVKLSCLAGLIDSPICELGNNDGIYYFYTEYEDVRRGIITLARSLGFGVKCTCTDGVYAIRVGVDKFIDELPIKDELKRCYKPVQMIRKTGIKNVGYAKNEVMGRKIKVNGSLFLVGYSLVPVA